MGTDIHGVTQMRYRSENSQWITVCEFERERNYNLFSVLAGIRCRFDHVDGVEPIQKSRGVPEGFELHEEEHIWGFDKRTTWMGDHSYGWCSLEEIEAWPHWDRIVDGTPISELVGEAFATWLKYIRLRYGEFADIRFVFGFDS